MVSIYVQKKKGEYHVMYKKVISEILKHYLIYSITSFKTEKKAYKHKEWLEKNIVH